MKRFLLITLLLFAPSQLYAQSVKLPSEVKATPGFVFITAETDCTEVKWISPDGLQIIPSQLLKDSKTAVGIVPLLQQGQTGASYRLYAYGAKGDKASEPALCTVIVGSGPAPPIPPGPGPVPPKPPDPPTPGPSPIPRDGFHVLIIEETEDRSKLPPAQRNILFDKRVRDYLNTKCATDPEVQNWKAWRIYDKDQNLAGENKLWQDALAKYNKHPTPYLVISTGKGGYEGPLPANVDDTLKLLKQYGGE